MLMLFVMFARLLAAADDAPLGGVEGEDAPLGDVPVGAPQTRRGGRPKGYQHTELTKTRLRLARMASERKAEANAVNSLGDVLQPGRAEYTIRTVFGGAPVANNQLAFVKSGSVLTKVSKATQTFKSTNVASVLHRGVASHVVAQGRGLASFVKGTETSKVEHILSNNVFDDAAMWVSMANVTKKRMLDDPRITASVKKGLVAKGNNVHMPVLNIVERLHVRRAHDAGLRKLRSATVHSPAQVLPTPNTSTVRHRWAQWSAMTSRGSGKKIDGDGSLNNALDATENVWRTMVMNKDNLGLNDCIVALEEGVLRAKVGAGGACEETLLSTSCVCHSAVLVAKPLYKRIGDLSSKLVRWGHLLEGGRTVTNFNDMIEAEVKDTFNYVQVPKLPEEVVQWRQHAEHILRLTRPAGDLSPEIESSILAGLNSNWDEERVTHFCIKGTCPLGCKGSLVASRKKCSALAVLLVGGSVGVPLEYRWKDMEKVSCKVHRGRRAYDLLRRACRRLYTKKAEGEAATRILQGNVNEAAERQMKQQARGSSVAFFRGRHQRREA